MFFPDKKGFYSELYLEDINDGHYTQTQKVFEIFKSKNLGDYHDLYVQSDTLLLADLFENFRNKCIETCELDPAHFSRLLKKTGVDLEILTDIGVTDAENGLRGGICHAIHGYTKAYNKYMKNYDKNIESSYLKYLHANNLYGWAIIKKLPVNGFKWIRMYLNFMKMS